MPGGVAFCVELGRKPCVQLVPPFVDVANPMFAAPPPKTRPTWKVERRQPLDLTGSPLGGTIMRLPVIGSEPKGDPNAKQDWPLADGRAHPGAGRSSLTGGCIIRGCGLGWRWH